MNSKRRAELQRKLTLNAVPRPPAGLSDRIKADIPRYLEAESSGSRFGRMMGVPLRIAAAMLLAVTSLIVTMNYVQQEAARETSIPVVFAPSERSIRDSAAASAPTEEVHLEIAQERPEADALRQLSATNAAPPAAPAAAPERRERVDARLRDATDEKKLAGDVEGRATGGVAGGRIGGFAAPQQVAEAAAPPPPPMVTAPAPEPPAMDRTMTVTAEAPTLSLIPEAHAAKIAAPGKKSVFGISVDPTVFGEIRATLEGGGRPQSTDVDIEALVNHFAGQPAHRPRGGVHFDVEASPAAIEAPGDHAVLRFSVDTPPSTQPGSALPVAKDARIEIDFNEQVVARAKRIGADDTLNPEPVLLYGTSVTGLYALELKPNLRSSQLVASVSLHYTSVRDGNTHTVRRAIHARDLARSWSHSTRRHRLASLGAVWGETLRGMSPPGFDLARRAEELATQDPKNPRAQELAAAASASGGGR